MKKGLPAFFASILAAATLLSVLSGCDYELVLTGDGTLPTKTPPLTTLPNTLPTTLPPGTPPYEATTPSIETMPSETIPEPTVPVIGEEGWWPDYVDPALCTVDGDARAAEQRLVCLNEYLSFMEWDPTYVLFFPDEEANPGWTSVQTEKLHFVVSVNIRAVELTFENGLLPPNTEIRYPYLPFDLEQIPLYCEDATLREDGSLLLPGRTLWLEASTSDPGAGFGEFWSDEPWLDTELSVYLDGDYSQNSLVHVRFFGTVIPTIEEVRAPSDIPEELVEISDKGRTRFSATYYEWESGNEVAVFEQTTIYGRQTLPGTSIELMTFAGRNVVRIRYSKEPDVYDLYWDDGEYRYRLYGSDEALLLRLAESIEARR